MLSPAGRSSLRGPRTQAVDGIKFGLRKQKGAIAVSDEAKAIERLRRLFPQRAEAMITVRESLDRKRAPQADRRRARANRREHRRAGRRGDDSRGAERVSQAGQNSPGGLRLRGGRLSAPEPRACRGLRLHGSGGLRRSFRRALPLGRGPISARPAFRSPSPIAASFARPPPRAAFASPRRRRLSPGRPVNRSAAWRKLNARIRMRAAELGLGRWTPGARSSAGPRARSPAAI